MQIIELKKFRGAPNGYPFAALLTEISDKFECAFSNQHSQVARIIALLEKVEGKSSSLNFPNDSIPQIDS
jgi:hypothetical protein